MKAPTVTEYMGIIRQPIIDLQIPGQFRGNRQMQYRFRQLDVSNQVLPDPDTSLTIGAVTAIFDPGGFQFFDQLESEAYMQKPFWQYTQVRNPDTVAHIFSISAGIFGASWNDVMVYARDSLGKLDTFPSSYGTPISQKAMPDWRNFFQLELGPGESKQLFVRVIDFDSHKVMPRTECPGRRRKAVPKHIPPPSSCSEPLILR